MVMSLLVAVAALITPAQAATSESALSSIISHSKVQYFGALNGPALGRPFGESYNVYSSTGLWPIQAYHELTYGYFFGSQYSVGLQVAGDQNIASGVVPAPGWTAIQPGLTVYDPVLQFSRSSLIDTRWLNVYTLVQASLPVTSYSQNLTRITQLTWDLTWTFKLPYPGWFAGLTTRVQPTFYRQPRPSPESWMNRQTFFASAGHFLGYQFSDKFQLKTTSTLDFDHTNDGINGAWDFGTGNFDRVRLQADYFLFARTARVGGWVQTPIFQPAVQNTIVGLDLSWDILPVRDTY